MNQTTLPTMTPNLQIGNLADHADLVETVAQWHFDEWSHLRPGSTLDDWIATRRRVANRWRIPMGFVALTGGELQGSASLIDCDMETRTDLWPWLAGVYVRSESRGQGIGAALVRHAMGRAADMGIRELYLYTGSTAPFYERLAWRVVGEELYRGAIRTLMSVDTRKGEAHTC